MRLARTAAHRLVACAGVHALATACTSSNAQRVYAAPTRASGLVTASIDSVRGSPLHAREIVVRNASTQPLIVYRVQLSDCRRVQSPCDVPVDVDVAVPPGEQRAVYRIEGTAPRLAPSYHYRYRWRYARNRQELDSLLAHTPPDSTAAAPA